MGTQKGSSRGCNSNITVGSSGYADDCIAWTTAGSMDKVGENLESISKAISSFMSNNFLILNNDKTQVLLVGAGRDELNSPIRVDEVMVNPSSCVNVLGVTFDSQLSPNPYVMASLRYARSLAGASRRLSLHLREPVLRQVVRALVVGKVAYGCAVLRPRLAEEDPISKDMAYIQTAINDCARAIIGRTRSDRIPVAELLQRTQLPSLNWLVIENIGVETWKGMNYETNGIKIPIGQILCPPTAPPKRVTRAVTSNFLPPPPPNKI